VETTQHGVRAHGNILAQAMSMNIEVAALCRHPGAMSAST
jgi:hypothetical protein